ncbi:membrane protein insertion efficiency factor YidD [Jiulongibacter sediminis]|uniref:membrane protein insertion efficiency factor YidD n=1 Tax=Jiulongibacter sediminis TaxID=1605367 RepID=UPI001E6339D3|nr:membrane protein insertion efficiency factor YidD [Jiulongibacter sediminis]
MKYTGIVFLLLSLLLCGNSMAQSSGKRTNLYRNMLEDGNIKKTYWQAQNNQNELQTAFSGLFLFYKTFFSSQDLTVCTFTPSCSEYGILAIKSHGMIKGGLMTMDRLTRCNGLSPQNYEFDKKLMLLKDDPTREPLVPVVASYK